MAGVIDGGNTEAVGMQFTPRAASILDMPMPGSKTAPRTFKGHHTDVETFIEQYDRLRQQNNVGSGEDACKTILQYCSKSVARFIEGLESFRNHDWNDLKRDILEYFDSERKLSRYTEADIRAMVRKQREHRISSLSKWLKYQRKFVAIAGWLLGQNRITAENYAAYFWKGIHRSLRSKLEDRLLAKSPEHDMTQPFDMKDIQQAATRILARNRFDQEETGTEESDDSELDSSDESSDSDDEIVVKRSKAKAKISRRALERAQRRAREDREDAEMRKAHQEDEMESLVKQLNSMSLNDVNYGLVYYRALKLDPDIAKVVRPPTARTALTQGPRNMGGMASASREEMTCYGCGEKGHGMSLCPKLTDAINKGLIMRGMDGRLVMKDGSRIPRNGNEPIIQAVERLTGTKTNLITLSSLSNLQYPSDESEYEKDDDEPEIYVATRQATKIKTNRKETFDGVYPPARPKGNYKQLPTKPAAVNSPTNTPVEVDKPMYDPDDDDAIMEDDNHAKQKSGPKILTPDATKRPPRAPKQSDIANYVKPMEILNRILSAPVTLAAGEIIGVSKEMSTLLQDAIKPKSQQPPVKSTNVVASSFASKTRGLLIRLPVFCDGKRINAILDTGSMLNICSRKIWKNIINRPMDVSKVTSMNDANGGEGKLTGLVEEVPITIGNVITQANMFVGDHVPFDLLLGRPWQRGNYITIDERIDGTYLLFKDPQTLDVRYEMLVTPDGLNPEWNHNPATWLTIDNASHNNSDSEMNIETINSILTISTSGQEDYSTRNIKIGPEMAEKIEIQEGESPLCDVHREQPMKELKINHGALNLAAALSSLHNPTFYPQISPTPLETHGAATEPPSDEPEVPRSVIHPLKSILLHLPAGKNLNKEIQGYTNSRSNFETTEANFRDFTWPHEHICMAPRSQIFPEFFLFFSARYSLIVAMTLSQLHQCQLIPDTETGEIWFRPPKWTNLPGPIAFSPISRLRSLPLNPALSNLGKKTAGITCWKERNRNN